MASFHVGSRDSNLGHQARVESAFTPEAIHPPSPSDVFIINSNYYYHCYTMTNFRFIQKELHTHASTTQALLDLCTSLIECAVKSVGWYKNMKNQK